MRGIDSGLVDKTIDGKKYAFARYGAKKSLKVLTRLTKIVGEPISMAMGAAKGDGPVLKRVIDTDVVGKAVRALVDRLDEDEVIAIVEDLVAVNATFNGAPINFDEHYKGDLKHLFKVLWAALEVQYGSFLEGFRAQLGDQKAPSILDLQT